MYSQTRSVVHQHVPHATAHQRFGLADFPHALPDRALRDLAQHNCGRLVGPGVRSRVRSVGIEFAWRSNENLIT
jgi:hypothetical protein